jgi:hypothetical protein
MIQHRIDQDQCSAKCQRATVRRCGHSKKCGSDLAQIPQATKTMQAMEADEDRIAAFHEAGHAVAAWAQGIGVEYATIAHEEGERGRIALEQEPCLLASVAEMERLIRVSLAGPMAQQRACGDAEIDQERAGADMIIVRALFIVITGGNIDRFPQFITRLRAETEALIFEPLNWARVLSVAAALVERRTLTGDELRDVINAVRVGVIHQRA